MDFDCVFRVLYQSGYPLHQILISREESSCILGGNIVDGKKIKCVYI